ncbi:hypothetical protein OEZ85_013949 [Tetradesmus obliquus]|uniref:Uncharacterized protein n=1 Tax=Tetradesmus obliquus TaxID=3088 RepID=A0ABY8UAE8_TETOB|nr:hypothetical protein OEZ85_013949 [Tetradesmus obliquus]
MVEALETDPLQLIIRHPSVNKQPGQICRLLCVSKALRAAIAARCNGQMVVKFAAYDIQHVQHFTPWLEKHGHLLKSLNLNLNLTGKEWLEAESLIASALQRAKGVSSLGLQMTTYRSYPACAGSVLQYLPTYYMRHLELGPRAEYSSCCTGSELVCCAVVFVLCPAVAALTQLTQLAIHDITAPTAASKLKWLPPQLLSLHMSLSRIRKCEALPLLQLGHLTRLTELSSSSKPLVLQEGDVLPASLVVLRVRDCWASTPLLPLTKLEVLDMSLSTTPAEVLLAVAAGLPQLREVSLCYGEMADAAAAAAGWSALPIRSLDFRAVEGCVSAATLQQLGKLQDLVRLDVYGGTGCCRHAGKFEATPQQFAAVLGQMTGLQELGLRGFELLPEPEPTAAADHGFEFEIQNGLNGLSLEAQAADGSGGAGGNGLNGTCSRSSSSASEGSSSSSGARARQGLATVMQAIANLPQLNSLTCCAIYSKGCDSLLPIDDEAAEQLASATQLTSLVLCDCGLQDSAVNTIAGSLKRLRKLKLDCNPGLTGEVLPASIAKELSQLSELCVLRTGIRKHAEGFKARLVSLHPGLTVKSSARG